MVYISTIDTLARERAGVKGVHRPIRDATEGPVPYEGRMAAEERRKQSRPEQTRIELARAPRALYRLQASIVGLRWDAPSIGGRLVQVAFETAVERLVQRGSEVLV
jgi:hypothetical protein